MLNMMIVDDEKNVRELIKRIIKWEYEGFKILFEAEDGKQAVSILEKDSVDIILADINMPNMNGLDFAEYAKIHFPETKVIILTAYNEFEYARKAVNTGVFYFLLKPVDAEELLCVVKKAGEALLCKSQNNNSKNKNNLIHINNTVYSRIVLSAEKYIQDNISDPKLNVSLIANSLHVSHDYLTFLFNKEMGMSVIKYLTGYRMEMSKKLMDKGYLNIEYISEKVGFSDPNYFSKCFKKHFGIPPSKYINTIL